MVGIAAANMIEIVFHKNMDDIYLTTYIIGGPLSRTKAFNHSKTATDLSILASILDVKQETFKNLRASCIRAPRGCISRWRCHVLR